MPRGRFPRAGAAVEALSDPMPELWDPVPWTQPAGHSSSAGTFAAAEPKVSALEITSVSGWA